ncbi:MAG: proline iminopeptidase-family hydrolase [Gammaproteobacteria bacterium]
MRAQEFTAHGLFPRKLRPLIYVLLALIGTSLDSKPLQAQEAGTLIEHRDGYVDSGGMLIYFETIGKGPPLMVLHGGPGSTHDYFLPFLLPLARRHQLVFIDERGSGRSQQLSDPKGYTLDAMAQDVEAVRLALNLGKIDLLGHSFGGILAQAYAIAHPAALRTLILAGTGSSAARIDTDFAQIKDSLDKNLRREIDAAELKGIIEKSGAQSQDYRRLADEAELPFNYHVRPPPWNSAGDSVGWDVLREMWVRHSDFHIDGNLRGFDFIPALEKLTVPTLIIYGDHDLVSRATAEQTHAALAGSQIFEVAQSGHMTFVDQPEVFMKALESFLAQGR